MDMAALGFALAALSAAIGAVVWVYRMRDSMQDKILAAVSDQLRHERTVNDRYYALREEWARLETRMDSMERILHEVHAGINELRDRK